MEESENSILQKGIDSLPQNFEHICRYCTAGSGLRPIVVPAPDTTKGIMLNEERQIGMLLLTYMQYDCDREKVLPKYICDDCIAMLSRWHRFRVRCSSTTELLRHVFKQMETGGKQLPSEPRDVRSYNIEATEDAGQLVYTITIDHEDGDQQWGEYEDEQEQEVADETWTFKSMECGGMLTSINVEKNTTFQHSSITVGQAKPVRKRRTAAGRERQSPKRKHPAKQCPVCGILVKAKLKLHLMRHADSTGRPFKCTQCDKAYRFNHSLTMHVLRVHEKLRFRCEVCSKQFSTKEVLRIHQKLHTNSEQEYRCDACGRCFKQLMYLRKHRSVHDADPQFRCDDCGKAFRLKQQLKQHWRIHTGEKPYECELCSKRFRSQTNLRQHNRRHLPEKPFECGRCGTTFSNRQSFMRHKNSSKCSRTAQDGSGTGSMRLQVDD